MDGRESRLDGRESRLDGPECWEYHSGVSFGWSGESFGRSGVLGASLRSVVWMVGSVGSITPECRLDGRECWFSGKECPGAHTQGATLDELQANLREVLELCLEEFNGNLDDLPQFVGVQQFEITL